MAKRRGRGRECRIVSPMCEGACVRFGTHWMIAHLMREFCKPMNDRVMSAARCVPNRLRRHGAYDLAGRVEASVCLDSLLLSHQGESKKKNAICAEVLIFSGNA